MPLIEAYDQKAPDCQARSRGQVRQVWLQVGGTSHLSLAEVFSN